MIFYRIKEKDRKWTHYHLLIEGDDGREWYANDRQVEIVEGDFEHDHQAIAWFKANRPDEFGIGAEMRALL